MSHISHITNPGLLVHPLYVLLAKKKPEPKTARTGDWIESVAVREANHDRDSDARDSDSESSDGSRGFDLTI